MLDAVNNTYICMYVDTQVNNNDIIESQMNHLINIFS